MIAIPLVLPPAVDAMARRGPRWADWVRMLPALTQSLLGQWELRHDPGVPSAHGHCSLVLPVRTVDGIAAMLKVGFPEEDSEHEHLALRRWGGAGAVRLLRADPHRRALLLERLEPRDLAGLPAVRACEVVAALYRQLHVPALPSLRELSSFIEIQIALLRGLPRGAPIPRRLVEQAITLGRDLSVDHSVPNRVLHTDLHYGNVLAAGRQDWLAIDPKPLNGDPHYEVAPMLWNRWDEIDGGRDVRSAVRQRFWSLVDAAGFDEERARAWAIVRMVNNAVWEMQETDPDPRWLTRCVAVAKAVQD